MCAVPGEYESKPVTEEEANHLNHTDDGTENHSHEDSQASHKRGPVQLQMANAPEKTWGGRGLESGQTYTFQRDGGDQGSTQPQATRKPAAAAPQADGRQRPPAAQAADKVADMGGGPGAGAVSPESDRPTSGQASLGEADHAPVKPVKPRTAANKVVEAMVIVQVSLQRELPTLLCWVFSVRFAAVDCSLLEAGLVHTCSSKSGQACNPDLPVLDCRPAQTCCYSSQAV